jgi:double-strand break repair protein MRE11
MFRLAVTSNINIGTREDSPTLMNDPLDSFTEILTTSLNLNSDALLIAGNLFNNSVVSNHTLSKTFGIMNQLIYGGRDIDFITKNFMPNYANENINIQMPIFAIHGNNDKPTNDKLSNCLDVFNNSLYLNYLGKILSFDQKILIKPIIFDKGDIKLAIYSISNIREIKISALLAQKKFQFVIPSDSHSPYFNILMINQKKSKSDKRVSFPSNDLFTGDFPDFFNLIIWGSEELGSDK